MAVDIASLGLAIDSTQVKAGTAELDKFGTAAQNVETKTNNVNRAFTQFNDGLTSTERAAKQAKDAAKALELQQQALGGATAQLTIGQQYFMDKLRDQAAAAGLSKTELLKLQAASMGLSDVSKDLITKIEGAASAEGHHTVSMGSSMAKMEMMRVTHDAMIGSYTRMGNSLFALGNYTGASTVLFTGLGAAILGVIAVAAGFGVAVAHAESFSRSLNGIETELAATGRATLIAKDQLKSLIEQMALMPGMSRSAAEETLSAFAKTHDIGSGLFKDLALLVTDFAAATGEKAPEAAKKLAAAFEDPVAGAKSLDKEFGTLTASQILLIEKMAAQNDIAGAQAVLMDALKASVGGLSHDGLTPMQHATDELKHSWDEVMKSMGDSSSLQTINELIVKLINSMKWIIQHGDGVGSAILRAFPITSATTLAFEGVSGMMSHPAGSQSATGKINFGQTAAPNGQTASALEDQVKGALKLGGAYESAAGRMEKMRTTAGVLTSAMHALSAQGKTNTDEYRKLADQLSGVDEAMAKKTKTPKTPGVDDSKAILDGQLKDIKATVDAEKAKYEQLNKLDDLYHKAGELSDTAYYADKRANFEAIAKAEISGYDKQIAQLNTFHAKTNVARQENLNRIQEVEAAKGKAVQAYADKRQILDTDEIIRQNDVVKASDAVGNKYISSLAAQATALEQANQTRGKSKAAIEDEIMARNDAAIAAMTENLAIQQTNGTKQAEIDQTEKLIKGLQDENVERGRISEAMKQSDVAKEYKSTFKSIDQSAHDTFVSMFDSGKSAFDRLRDTLKSGLLDVLYQMTIKKWIVNIETSMTGGASGGGGGIGGLLSGLFGGGSSDSSPSSLISGAAEMGIGLFADGGDPPVNTPYLTGEKGVELHIDKTPGTIIPNNVLTSAKSGGSTVVHNNITINATVGDVASKSDVVAGMQVVKQQMAVAISRNSMYGGSAG